MKKYFIALESTSMQNISPGSRCVTRVRDLALLMGLFLVAVGAVFPTAAMAGQVHGRVCIVINNHRCRVLHGNSFSIERNGKLIKRVTTGANGSYLVVLDRGIYYARYCDSHHSLWRARFYSTSGQIKQNIRLMRRSNEQCPG